MTRVLLAFVAVNLGLLAVTGVHLGGDTGLYVEGARRLLAGLPLVERQPSYLGYVAVVAVCQAIGIGLMGVVLLQVAVATLAAGAVYKIAFELGGSRAGLLSTALLAADLETNRWHGYVLADSLYLSAFTVSAWLVYRAGDGRRGWYPYLIASVALIAAGLIRPEGWVVIPAAATYWVLRGARARSQRWTGVAAICAAFATLVLVAAPRLTGNLEAVGPGEMLRRGQTIWDYEGWRISMPDAPPFGVGWDGVRNTMIYAVRRPFSTLTLMAARVGVHLAHVRPFYSTTHNVLIAVWLLPVYVFGAYGAWVLRRHTLARWCGIAIGTQALVVALTHADWDGRYLAHVLPLAYPLTASGLALVVAPWIPARLGGDGSR